VTDKGGEFSLTVKTAAECQWSASSSPSWIAIRSGSGAGDGRVTYAVSANEGSARTGKIEVGGATIAISQDPKPQPEPCRYGVSPLSQSASATGGEFSLSITTRSDCKWSASSGASWIVIRSGGGAGDGRVTYAVSANDGSARTGKIEVGGTTVTISQDPKPQPEPCKYEVSPLSQAAPAKGSDFSLSIATRSDCKWSASSSASWIVIRSGSGAGEGRVTYAVSANEGSARTGKIEVGGTTVTISQEAMPKPEPTCTVTLSPSSQAISIEGGVFSIKVGVDSRCKWSAESRDSWILVKSGSGAGSGEVVYVVERNSGLARSGAIVVSGQGVKVSQAGVK
jgi:hypothetical protein